MRRKALYIYRMGELMPEELGKFDEVDEEKAQKFYTQIQRFISVPWEKRMYTRAPRSKFWWKKGIGNAQKRRKKLTRR